jgi:hypothetical protein
MTRDQWMRLLRLAMDADDDELAHEVAVEMANAEKRELTRRGVGPKQGRLKPAMITELRRAYWSVPRPSRPSYDDLAKRYGIGGSTVSRIINRQRYTDLEYVPGEDGAPPIDLDAIRARAADALEGGPDIAIGKP